MAWQYPQIDPVALHIGPLAVRWYGLMYLLGFLCAWLLAYWRSRSSDKWDRQLVDDLIFYSALGVIIGGRVGYMVFYEWPLLISKPWSLVAVWQGGMSFHGGLLGVMLALLLFCRHKRKHFIEVADFVVPLVPIGLGLGRIGNFINGELWGRVTDLPWGMVFPRAGPLPRHPSQLYEFVLEGVVLFVILWLYSKRRRPAGAVSGLFLLLYGVFRFMVEFVRQPDPQLGFIAWGWLTMGQLLSAPMVLAGIAMISWTYTQNRGCYHDSS